MVGTRPEAIKQAPVVWALRERPERFEVTVVSTGQHSEMLAQVLPALDLELDIDLELMARDQSLPGLTAACLRAFDEVLGSLQPDIVLVQGDTTTAMSCALAAFYRRIEVGHVEAGLRSRNLAEPFPEEANRVIIDDLARWLFAPTRTAVEALVTEGRPHERIFETGNTVVDALETIAAAGRAPRLPAEVERSIESGAPLILITCHRRESFGEPLRQICLAIRELAGRYPEHRFVFPVHLNPHVADAVHTQLSGLANLHLIEPLPYDSFVTVLSRSALVLTDSGGVQEEAPALGVPAIVMRNVTERPEGVAAGCAQLVGTRRAAIVEAARGHLDGSEQKPSPRNLYGDGKAGRRIAAILAGGS